MYIRTYVLEFEANDISLVDEASLPVATVVVVVIVAGATVVVVVVVLAATVVVVVAATVVVVVATTVVVVVVVVAMACDVNVESTSVVSHRPTYHAENKL